MSDNPGRKADLDKEGIALTDTEKAELDKDGIPLGLDEAAPESDVGTPQSTQETNEAKPQGKKGLSLLLMKNKRLTLALIGGAVGLILILSVGGFILYHASTVVPVKTTKAIKPQEHPTFGADGGMLMDPFIVFYDTHDTHASGVLIAQVSLHVDPEEVPNIQSRFFDIRDIIFKKLASTASVYSEPEIEKMLSQDLLDFQVKDVAFIQYQKR
jgi:hypothetical protein